MIYVCIKINITPEINDLVKVVSKIKERTTLPHYPAARRTLNGRTERQRTQRSVCTFWNFQKQVQAKLDEWNCFNWQKKKRWLIPSRRRRPEKIKKSKAGVDDWAHHNALPIASVGYEGWKNTVSTRSNQMPPVHVPFLDWVQLTWPQVSFEEVKIKFYQKVNKQMNSYHRSLSWATW